MLWWSTDQSGLSEPSFSSRLRRGGFGGGEQAMKRFCSLWELCRSRLWPIWRKDRSPKLSVWAFPMWEMWRKSANGRLIMLTDSTSLRLEFLLDQRPEDCFRYNDVLSGILANLLDLNVFICSFHKSSKVFLLSSLWVDPQELVKFKSIMRSSSILLLQWVFSLWRFNPFFLLILSVELPLVLQNTP